MLTLDLIAAVLAAYPDELPPHARRLVLDVACGRTNATAMSSLVIRVLQRPDITADEAREVYAAEDAHGAAETRVVAAWLARPEHPIDALPDLIVAEANRTAERVDELVSELLTQPLCRPQIALKLATANDPTLVAAVAAAAAVTPDVRDIAVRHADWLLTPDPAQPPKRYPAVPVEFLAGMFATVAKTEPAHVAAWSRNLRTVPLILAAAVTLAEPDEVTARHAIHAAVLPTLAGKLTGAAAANVNAIIVRSRKHLDQPTRLEVADAIDNSPNASQFDYLATMSLSLRVADDAQPLRKIAYAVGNDAARAEGARHLISALGENDEAWRVLRAAVTKLTDSATAADVVTMALGISYEPRSTGD